MTYFFLFFFIFVQTFMKTLVSTQMFAFFVQDRVTGAQYDLFDKRVLQKLQRAYQKLSAFTLLPTRSIAILIMRGRVFGGEEAQRPVPQTRTHHQELERTHIRTHRPGTSLLPPSLFHLR